MPALRGAGLSCLFERTWLDFYLDFVKAIGLLVPQLHTILGHVVDDWIVRGILDVGKLAYAHCFGCGVTVDDLTCREIRASRESAAVWSYKVQVVINIRRHIAAENLKRNG